jgi:hypothetical protein
MTGHNIPGIYYFEQIPINYPTTSSEEVFTKFSARIYCGQPIQTPSTPSTTWQYGSPQFGTIYFILN